MRNALLVKDGGDAPLLRESLERMGHRVIGEISGPATLKASVEKLDPDVIVVATHTPANALFHALTSIAELRPKPVVMFAKDPHAQLIRKSVECGVSAYVVDGWSPERITPIIEAAIARFEAYAAVKKELAHTRNQLSERKLIDKAKGIVMQQRGLTEEQAYSALRKMAMDQSVPLAEVARRIISVAQLLS
ncbi:MAG: ANTAR domain-containing response regulator [Burkholderiales bacterium]